jgi:hypothetical protein
MLTITETAEEQRKDIESIMQISLFDDITDEDVRKTLWLLNLHPKMLDVIKNYELAQKVREDGLSEYEMATAYGTAGRRVTGQETMSDTTANTIILKDKRAATYEFYKHMSKIIGGVIRNIRDPHEAMIAKLLFIDGMRVGRAQGYMTRIKKTIDIYPIAVTTFFEKRRKVIANITNSLKIIGTLDYVEIDTSAGRGKDGECRFILPEWQ